ncbi:MAG: signal peptidase I [Candidatus Zipacnadales bacterium]
MAFDRPWQIVGLIGLAVILRLVIPRLPGEGRWRASLLEFDDSLLIALLVVFCVVRPFVLQTFYIPSGSMLPTLQEQDRIIVLKCWYRFMDPQPGDIVVFRAPKSAYYSNPGENPDLNVPKDFIKRLVGVPGNRLRVEDTVLYRDGQPQSEPFIKWPRALDWPDAGDLIVPPNCFVLMGDNRNNSNDSTRWCLPVKGTASTINAPFVSREMLQGKAWLIFWPVNRIRILR